MFAQSLRATTLAGIMLVSTASPIFASSTASGSPRPFLQNAEDRQEMRQENRGTRRDARFERVANRVEERSHRHEQRLTNLIQRVEARANKMQANGKDVGAALTHIAQAKTLLTEAVSLKSTATTNLRAVEKEKWNDQDTEVKAAKAAVKAAEGAFKKVLDEVLAAIKALAAVAGK